MSNETLSAEELGNKLLQSVKEMNAGKAARVSRVEPNERPLNTPGAGDG